MNKSSFKRYIWLIDTVYQSEKEGISYEEICQKWRESSLWNGKGYPLRTFHNHRKEIADIFNVDIKCRKSTNKYYVAENKATGSLQRRLMELISVNQIVGDSKQLQGRVQMELNPGGERYLAKVMDAIAQCQYLCIRFCPLGAQKEVEYARFAPLALKEFRGSWHLLGKPDEARFEFVDLKEVVAMQSLPENFAPMDNAEVEAVLVENYGARVEDVETQEVMVKVDAALARRFRNAPLHISQREIESKESHSIFYLYLKPTVDFCQDMVLHHPDVEVLAPLTLRSEIEQKVKRASKK